MKDKDIVEMLARKLGLDRMTPQQKESWCQRMKQIDEGIKQECVRVFQDASKSLDRETRMRDKNITWDQIAERLELPPNSIALYDIVEKTLQTIDPDCDHDYTEEQFFNQAFQFLDEWAVKEHARVIGLSGTNTTTT